MNLINAKDIFVVPSGSTEQTPILVPLPAEKVVSERYFNHRHRTIGISVFSFMTGIGSAVISCEPRQSDRLVKIVFLVVGIATGVLALISVGWYHYSMRGLELRHSNAKNNIIKLVAASTALGGIGPSIYSAVKLPEC